MPWPCRLLPGPVDCVTIAFGIRNVQGTRVALDELYRVLRPGGRLAILEFGLPQAPGLRQLYRWYFLGVLPRVGRLVSKHGGAYSYLPESVGAFPWGAEFATHALGRGFFRCASQTIDAGRRLSLHGPQAVTGQPVSGPGASAQRV